MGLNDGSIACWNLVRVETELAEFELAPRRDSVTQSLYVEMPDTSELTQTSPFLERLARYSNDQAAVQSFWGRLGRATEPISDADELATLGYRKYLNLGEFKAANINAVAEHPFFETLEELALFGTETCDADVAALLKGRCLRKLDLSRTWITDEGVKQLAQLKSLEELRLTGIPITKDCLLALCDLPNLKELWIDETLIRPEDTLLLSTISTTEEIRVSADGQNTLDEHREWSRQVRGLRVICQGESLSGRDT